MLNIIIPTYNSENTIKKCLNSVIALNKYNIFFKIFLVDDGSNDNTRRINNIYAEKYNNITSLKQDHRGVSVARNSGLSYASGSWVCFLDSDDTLNAYNLVKIYHHYAKLNNMMIISNINKNDELIGVTNVTLSNVNLFINKNYPIYKKFTIMDLSGKIYNLNLIKRFNIKFPLHVTIGEDFIFTLRFLICITKGQIVQTPLSYYNYCVNSGSSVINYDNQSIKNRTKIFITLKKVYEKFNLPLRALNWIRIEMIYSILLNDLKLPSNRIKMLSHDKKQIKQSKLLSTNNYTYNKIECVILNFIFKQPSILLLYFVLKCINLIRRN